jgi:hypothetical protein
MSVTRTTRRLALPLQLFITALVAKRAGRNRVEMLGADYASLLTDVEAAVRTGIRRPFVDLVDPLATKMRARRSRAVGAVRDDCSPRERT